MGGAFPLYRTHVKKCNDADDGIGIFSVSPNKQVSFAKGNLQYTQSTQTWSFAEHQYDMIGTANISGSSLADKIDLFGWSGSTGSAQWGISTSTDYNDYSGDFVDWGKNISDSNTWYTLSRDEWNYLCKTRTGADNLIGVAHINLNEDGSEYANGLILLPDTWICPENVTFKSGFASEYSIQAYADYQTFPLSDWQKLEAAGAVFLPAAGCRMGLHNMTDMEEVQYYGRYWSATPYDMCFVVEFYYNSRLVALNNCSRNGGLSIRLVQNVK